LQAWGYGAQVRGWIGDMCGAAAANVQTLILAAC
jgi:hypothetical protein